MTTATKPLKVPSPETLTPPATTPPPAAEPAAADLGWEHHGSQADWGTFLVWFACFLLMVLMLAYDMIAALLGL